MFRRFSANFAVLSIFFDLILVACALLLAVMLRGPLGQLDFVKEIAQPVVLPMLLYVLFPLVWVGVLLLFAVYDGRRNLRIVDEFASLSLGSLLAVIAMAGVLYLTYRDVSRFLFLMFVAMAFALLLGWRLIARWGFRRAGVGTQVRRVIILGAGKAGRRIAEQIAARPYLGLKLVGFLDDNAKKQAYLPEVLGPLEEARLVVLQQKVDDVIIALPQSAHQRLAQVVGDLQDLPVRVRVIPDYYSLVLHRASVEEFADLAMLDLRAPALTEYQRMVKRGFDLLICVMGLPFLLPILAALAAAIKLDSPGPVFYLAERVGENGRVFHMVKFRTMIQNAHQLQHLVVQADEHGHVLYKRRDDPRVTRVGRWLRRTSLDELPQVFNVLMGEMSLVGPRPEIPAMVERYSPWQRARFVVPQGITGWWQVNGRSDKPMHLNTQDDLYYVQHYSIWLDLQILFRTVWTVIRGRGAF